MLTITPPPRCAIERAAARVPKNVPSRWTASIVRHSSSGSRTRASSGVETRSRRALGQLLLGARNHALCLRGGRDAGVVDPDVDRGQRGLCLVEEHDRRSAPSLTSARTATPPQSSAVSRAASSLTSSTATRAPSRASRRQMASPMPEPPPVTTATFPSSVTGRPPPFRQFRRCGVCDSPRSRPRAVAVRPRFRSRQRAQALRPRAVPAASPKSACSRTRRAALCRKRAGTIPPPTPTTLTWPPVDDDRCRELDGLLAADEVEDDGGSLGARLRSDVARL